MAYQNGIITGFEAAKLYSYPTLAGGIGSILAGDGTWLSKSLTAETIVGGTKINWADGSMAVSLPTDPTHTETLTSVFDSDTGVITFSRENGTDAFSFNAYELVSHVSMSTNSLSGALEYSFPNGNKLFDVPVASGE